MVRNCRRKKTSGNNTLKLTFGEIMQLENIRELNIKENST